MDLWRAVGSLKCIDLKSSGLSLSNLEVALHSIAHFINDRSLSDWDDDRCAVQRLSVCQSAPLGDGYKREIDLLLQVENTAGGASQLARGNGMIV